MVSMTTKLGEYVFLDKRNNGGYELMTNCSTLVNLIGRKGKVIKLMDKKKFGNAAGNKVRLYYLSAKEWKKISADYDRG